MKLNDILKGIECEVVGGSTDITIDNLVYDSRKTTNFDRIDGEELVFEDVESVVCGGSCYYFSDGVIYN